MSDGAIAYGRANHGGRYGGRERHCCGGPARGGGLRAMTLDARAVPKTLYAAMPGRRCRRRLIEALFEPLHPADIADLCSNSCRTGPSARNFWLLAGASHRWRNPVGDRRGPARRGNRRFCRTRFWPKPCATWTSDDVVDLIEDLDAPQKAALLAASRGQPTGWPSRQALSLSGIFRRAPDADRSGRARRSTGTSAKRSTFLRGAGTSLPDQFYHVDAC